MFTGEDVRAIRRLAASLKRDAGAKPSSHLLEVLVDKADSPLDGGLEELCGWIDIFAAEGKLGDGKEENERVAKELKELMCLFPGDTRRDKSKRAMALRWVNKLKGVKYWEPTSRERGK